MRSLSIQHGAAIAALAISVPLSRADAQRVSSITELRSALANVFDGHSGGVLVDLSDCAFIDSTGLSLLVETKRSLAEESRRFGVCCPDADVRRLLELTGIDQAVGLFDTRDEAIAALSTGAAA